MSQQSNFPKAFFVTGTDTGVGKTVVSAILTLGLQAHYWKPIQSGTAAESANNTVVFTDSDFIASVGVRHSYIIPERHVFSQPLSPHLAARLDGQSISLNDFLMPDCSEMKHLIVEGAGGLLVPLNENDKVIDLIFHLKLPVLLVARSGLGTINHTLLSLSALRARGIEILGVVMNGEANAENRKAIEQFGNVNVLAEIPPLPNFERDTLKNCFSTHVDRGTASNAPATQYDLASVHTDAYSRPGT